MVSYSEIRSKQGKEAADKYAREHGVSDLEIARASKSYEETEAFLFPQAGLQNIANKMKKVEKTNIYKDAMVSAWDWVKETLNLGTDVLAQKEEPESEFVKEVEKTDVYKSVEAGAANSVLNKGYRYIMGENYTPNTYQPKTIPGKAANILTAYSLDSGIYAAGALPGALLKKPKLASAGAFSLHSYLDSWLSQELAIDSTKREEYMKMLMQEMVDNPDQAINLIANQDKQLIFALNRDSNIPEHSTLADIWEATKGGITGLTLGYVAGKSHNLANKMIETPRYKKFIANKSPKQKALTYGATHATTAFAGEVGAFATVPPILEGRIPTTDDFLESALAITTFRATKVGKTWDNWKKDYVQNELKKHLAEDNARTLSNRYKTEITSKEERRALLTPAEEQGLINKAVQDSRGLTNGNVIEALQLEYIISDKKPAELVDYLVKDDAAWQGFIFKANDIMKAGGLANALRDPIFREKYLPVQDFTPIEAKQEDKKEGEVNPDAPKELYVGPRNKKLEDSKRAAEELLNSGKLDREGVRKKTGWDIVDVVTTAGDKKRFFIYEINDQHSKIAIDTLDIKEGSTYTLQQIFDHPDLYNIFPWLRNLRVDFSEGKDGRVGSANPYTLRLWFNTKYVGDAKELRKTLIHEIQHIIQSYEEWGQGGGVRGVDPAMPDDIKPYYNERKSLVPELKKGLEEHVEGFDVKSDVPVALDVWRWEMEQIAAKDPVYAEKYNRFMELLQYTNIYEAKTAYGRYFRLWGENQARDAEKRADWTPEQRAAISPEASQDFPTGTTIVSIGDKIYPHGDYEPNAKNKSTLYSKGDKMNIYVGYKEAGTFKEADNLGDICLGFIKEIYGKDQKSIFKEKMSQGKNTLGVYYFIQDFIRIRGKNDISSISHELAHRIEDKEVGGLGTFFPDEYKKELTALATKGGVKPEGFAEMVSYYLIDPDYAKKVAPKAYNYFVDKMSKEFPKTMKILNKYQDKIRLYQEQPSFARLANSMSLKATKNDYSVLSESEKLYTAMVDDLYPVKVYVDVVRSKMTEAERAAFDASNENPYHTMRRLKGIAGRVNQFIERKPVKLDGSIYTDAEGKTIKNLKSIVKGLKEKELEEFDVYLKAKHAIELKNVHGNNLQLDVDINDCLSEVERLAPKYETRAQDVYKLMDAMLSYAKEGELISETSYKRLRKLYPSYVPTIRLEHANEVGNSKIDPNNPIKAFHGSDTNTLRTTAAIEEYINKIVIETEKNQALIQMAKLAELPGAGAFMRPIKESGHKVNIGKDKHIMKETKPNDPMGIIGLDNQTGEILGVYKDIGQEVWVLDGAQRSKNEFRVKRGDNYQIYVADPEIIRPIYGLYQISGNNPKAVEAALKLAKLPTKMERAGATMKPTWMVNNFIVDQGTATLNSKYKYMPLWDAVIGALNIAFDTDVVRQWENYGGSQNSYFPKVKNGDYTEVMNKYYSEGWTGSVLNKVKSVADILPAMGEFSDKVTRVGEFRNVYKHLQKHNKLTPEDAGKKAAFESRDVTLDFSRAGYVGRVLNEYITFFNADIQGKDKHIRTIMEHPLKMSAMLLTLGLIFCYNEEINIDDEDIQDLSNVIHDTNLIIRGNDGVIYKIGIPRELAPMKATIRRLYQDEGFKDFGKDMLGSALNKYLPAGLSLILEPTTNYDFFRQRNLVPAHLEKELGEYQYTAGTTETSKEIAAGFRKMGVDEESLLASPIMVENVANNLSGGLAGKAMQAIDSNFLDSKIDPYAEQKGVMKSTFTLVNTPYNNKYVDSYYDVLTTLEKYSKAFEKDLKTKGVSNDKRRDMYMFYKSHSMHFSVVSNLWKERNAISDGKIKFDTKEKAVNAMLNIDKKIVRITKTVVKDYSKVFK